MMNGVVEVKNNNLDFRKLCEYLEEEHRNVIKEQRSLNGNCLNNLEKFTKVYIYYINKNPVASIAMKTIDNGVIEIGRVYVKPEYRKNHIAFKLFQKVIEEATKLGANKLILDTYERFSAAINLYKKLGFYQVDNYIKNSPYSICMEKKI